MNVKIVDVPISIELSKANYCFSISRYKWILRSNSINPLLHVFVCRCPSFTLCRCVVTSVYDMGGIIIEFPEEMFVSENMPFNSVGCFAHLIA